jgi:hypothetical protein
MQTVHVRVNDAATGQPTPVRIRFTGPDGTYYAPFGRLTDFATGWNQDVGGNLLYGEKKYAYIDGTCEIRLPPGPIVLDVSKGPEYLPVRQEVILRPGQLSLRPAVQRWSDLRRDGWYAGDSGAHSLGPHAALLEAAAEDLAVVNLLARACLVQSPPDGWWGPSGGRSEPEFHPAIPNILAFSGQRPALDGPGHMVVVNTHNRHPTLGSLGLLNCHRVVYPLTFGGEGEADDWSLADWCDQCHRKGGLVVWADESGRRSAPKYFDCESLADLILGKIDALEVVSFGFPSPQIVGTWYQLLNSGLHVPLVGGSTKSNNGVPLGCVRTYARLSEGEEFTYRTWIEAVRAGRTFATNGPLLSFTANGREPGTALDAAPSSPIRVHAEARSLAPFERLELVANGSVVGTAAASGSPGSAFLDTDLTLPAGGWLAARCHGPERLPGYFFGQCVYAHTSALTVRVDGRAPWRDPHAVADLVGHLDKMLGWVERKARCANDRQREHLADIFRSARAELLRRQDGTAPRPPRRGDGNG